MEIIFTPVGCRPGNEAGLDETEMEASMGMRLGCRPGNEAGLDETEMEACMRMSLGHILYPARS